jgi:hypothetical protein
MDNKKKLTFSIDADDHARMRVKLQYDRMSQSMFFNALIKAYLEDNLNLKIVMDENAIKYADKKTLKQRARDTKEHKEVIEEYGLNKDEISNIFDILEKENEDI